MRFKGGKKYFFVIFCLFLMLYASLVFAIEAFLVYPFDKYYPITQYVYDDYTIKHNLPTYVYGNYRHSGTDYDAPLGTPVYAAAGGRVVEAVDGFGDGCQASFTDGGGYGNHVVLSHDNGYFTIYAHLSKNSLVVSLNEEVRSGQEIGRVGSSGFSMGDDACGRFEHLHFEVRTSRYGNFVNPYNLETGCLFLDGCQNPRLPFLVSYYPLTKVGYLDAHGGNPKISSLASGSFDGGARDGLAVSTSSDDHIYYYEVFHEGSMGQALDKIDFFDAHQGINPEIKYLVSGNFLGGEEEIFAVSTVVDSHIYFYYNFGKIGWTESFGKGVFIDQMTSGDFDGDGQDELAITPLGDDRIYILDKFRKPGFFSWFGKFKYLSWLDPAQGKIMSHVYNFDPIYGFPKLTNLVSLDFDQDGQDEIVVSTKDNDKVYAYDNRKKRSWDFYNMGFFEAHDNEPEITFVSSGDFSNDSYDELAITTTSDDHIYFYGYNPPGNHLGDLFSKLGYIDAHGGNPSITNLSTGDFNTDGMDELVVTTSCDDHIYFYKYTGQDRKGGKIKGEQKIVSYKAKIIEKPEQKIILPPNQEKELSVTFRNMGPAFWFSEMKNTVVLSSKKAKSNFYHQTWSGKSEIALLFEEIVRSGEETTFVFKIKAPGRGGDFKETFGLKVKEGPWISGSFFDVEILVDDKPPTTPSDFSADKTSSFWVDNFTSDSRPSFTWKTSEDLVSGLEGYFLAIFDETPDGQGELDYWVGNKTTFTLPSSLADGKYTAYVAAKDKVGNISKSARFTFFVDNTPPELPSYLWPDKSSDTWYENITFQKRPTFFWKAAKDKSSGLAGYFVSIDKEKPQGRGDFDWELSYNDTSFTLPDNLAEGWHTFYLTTFDRLGNTNKETKSYKFAIDLSPPDKVSQIQGDTKNSTWYGNKTNDLTPSFTWQESSDEYSGLAGYLVAIDKAIPSESDYVLGDVTSWTVPSALTEGQHFITIISYDHLGFKSSQEEGVLGDAPYFSFIIDRSAPSGSIKINHDEKYTNKEKVSLEIKGEDVSGISEFQISENGQDWQSFDGQNQVSISQEIDWIFQGTDGQIFIYLRFKDVFGHFSSTISDSIILDTQPPTSYVNNLALYQSTLSFLVSWFGQDIMSGILSFDIQYKDSAWQQWVDWFIGTDLFEAVFEGIDGLVYQFRSRAQDLANNKEDWPDDPDTETKVDITAPIPPTILSPERDKTFNSSADINSEKAGVQIMVAGRAEEESWIELSLIYEDETSNHYETRSDKQGTWQIEEVDLKEGKNIFKSVSFDAAGNSNDSGEYLVYLDSIPPAKILDLEVITPNKYDSSNYDQALLSWTAPGDDEMQDRALVYYLRYSKSRITEENFDQAQEVENVPTPSQGGSNQTFVLEDLLPKTEYWFAIKTCDEAGNCSEISNTPSYTTPTSADSLVLSLVSDQSTLVADNVSMLEFEVEIFDPQGRKGEELSGEPVYCQISDTNGLEGNTGSLSQIQDKGLGTYSFFFQSPTKVGDGEVKIRCFDDQAMTYPEDESGPIYLIPGKPYGKIELQADRLTIEADGQDISNISTSEPITDQYGNIVADGEKIKATSTLGMLINEVSDSSIILKTVAGHISFKLQAGKEHGQAQINLKSEQGEASGQIIIELLDITPPDPPRITSPKDGQRTNNKRPTISGEAEPGARVLIYKSYQNSSYNYFYYIYASDSGRFSYSPGETFYQGDGSYGIKAKARDAAENTSGDSNEVKIEIDTQGPSSVITSPEDGSQTINRTPIISGQTESNARVYIYRNNTNVALVTASSSGSFSYTSSSLPDGVYQFKVRSEDDLGNLGEYSNTISITIDTTKPDIFDLEPQDGQIFYHEDINISASYTDRGTGINKDTVILKIDGSEVKGKVTSSKITYQGEFEHGQHTGLLEVKDMVGNKAQVSWSFKIQTASFFLSSSDSDYNEDHQISYHTSIVSDWPNTKGPVLSPKWWEPDFNDSSWSKKVYPSNSYPTNVPLPEKEAMWLWADQKVDKDETSLFRIRFEIPKEVTIIDAAIRMSGDNEAWAWVGYINGQYFGKVPESLSGENPYTFGITDLIAPGENILAIQASNGDDLRAGFAFTMTIRYHD